MRITSKSILRGNGGFDLWTPTQPMADGIFTNFPQLLIPKGNG
jgi:hypothetical protein